MPRDRDAIQKEMLLAARRHQDPVQAITAVRAIRRRELFRIAAADLLGDLDTEQVGYALTDLMAATLEAALLRRDPGHRGRAPRPAADPDGDRGDGPLRRWRAELRQ